MRTQHLSFALALTLMLFVAGCAGGKRHERQPRPGDTIYTERAVASVCAENPRLALEMIDSSLMLGNITPDKASYFRARAYSVPGSVANYDTARQICVDLLKEDVVSKNLNYRFNVLEQLRCIAYQQNDDEDLIRWSTELIKVCREQNDEIEALRCEAEIGYTLTRLGRREEGLQKLDKVIDRLDKDHHFGGIDACIVAMKRKLRALVDGGDDMAQAAGLAGRMIAKIDDYERHAAAYADDSFRQIDDEEVARYCDFYRAQALALAARACAAQGQMRAADGYVARFEKTGYAHTAGGRERIVPAWMLVGHYDKVLVAYEELERKMGADTVNAEYVQILKDRAVIAGSLGQYAASENYWNRYARLSDRLAQNMLAAHAQSYAARYHAQEQEMEIQRQKAALKRSWIVGAMLVLGLLAAIICVIYFMRQRSLMKAKNRVLTEQINEALEFKQKYHEIIGQQAGEPDGDAPADDTPAVSFGDMTNEELFGYLSGVIERERLFLLPDFGRDTLADRFHLSYAQIGAAFAQGSRFNSLPDYVRDCRLSHACRLLHDNPEMSIGEVATASGFTSLSVFGRDFKQKYALSPSAYRNRGD